MKRVHPKLGLAVAFALSAFVTSVGGCSHGGAPNTNPFSAPTRVPPPSTRMITPGTAQPYYPGDPLPVMQSAAPPPRVAPVVASASAGTGPKKLAISKEPSVAIPGDGNSLRFELPAPPMEPAPHPRAVATSPPATAPSSTFPTASASTAVIPAVYTAAPTAGPSAVPVATPVAPAEPAPPGPWRSPQIVAPPMPAPFVPQSTVTSIAAPPVVAPSYSVVPASAQPTIDVSLRAVPSPPPLLNDAPSPRIRIPGYPAPAVSLTPVPPTESIGSVDGFRPRSSMR